MNFYPSMPGHPPNRFEVADRGQGTYNFSAVCQQSIHKSPAADRDEISKLDEYTIIEFDISLG
jgi:hypothetical protein